MTMTEPRNALDAAPAEAERPVEDDWPCEDCGKTFTTWKGKRVHQASHKMKACQWCGIKHSLRGIVRHEAWCERQPRGGGANVFCPAPQWRSRLEDFLERTREPPANSFLVMADDFGPAFLSAQQSAVRTLSQKGPTLVLAAELIADAGVLELPTVRNRRQTGTWDRHDVARAEQAWEREEEQAKAVDLSVEMWPCSICDELFTKLNTMRKHRARHTTAPCAWCETEQPVGELAAHEKRCTNRPTTATTKEDDMGVGKYQPQPQVVSTRTYDVEGTRILTATHADRWGNRKTSVVSIGGETDLDAEDQAFGAELLAEVDDAWQG